jgi:hypothetical protein
VNVRSASQFTITDGKIVEIDVIVDPEQLGDLQATILE